LQHLEDFTYCGILVGRRAATHGRRDGLDPGSGYGLGPLTCNGYPGLRAFGYVLPLPPNTRPRLAWLPRSPDEGRSRSGDAQGPFVLGLCEREAVDWVPSTRALRPLQAWRPQAVSGHVEGLPMITLDVTSRPRLKHHGKAKGVRERIKDPRSRILERSGKWCTGITAPEQRGSVQRFGREGSHSHGAKRSVWPTPSSSKSMSATTIYGCCPSTTTHWLACTSCARNLSGSISRTPRLSRMEYHFNHQLIPALGTRTLREITIAELQVFFNGLHPRMPRRRFATSMPLFAQRSIKPLHGA
jgi:hypothetical protein